MNQPPDEGHEQDSDDRPPNESNTEDAFDGERTVEFAETPPDDPPPDATFPLPQPPPGIDQTIDLAATVEIWDGALQNDVTPDRTIKVEPEATQPIEDSFDSAATLKRRDVSHTDDTASAQVAESDANADYRIERLLGEGGIGAVYAARQHSLDRTVAIKLLKPLTVQDADSERAFVAEAMVTGGLEHPNIVPIYDIGRQADDELFYAMKQVQGVEWKERIGTYTVKENLDVLLRVADAIAFAHSRCIIHRDLKPANIMLGAFGEVLVMDWGLAMPTPDHPRYTSFPPPNRAGTPLYMAPEMADDPAFKVDRRSDVYLLGAILFEIATGKPPHRLDTPAATPHERIRACLVAVAQNTIAATDVTGELIDIARKALATERDDRYQTVPEFQAAIREYLAHEESISLATRAAAHFQQAKTGGGYEEFNRAKFGFESALEEWPDNETAAAGLQETTRDYADAAFQRGDFDLALSLLDESNSDHAPFRATVLEAIAERDTRAQRIRRLRQLSLAASLAVAVVTSVAAVWINSERNRAEAERANAVAAQQKEAEQRALAITEAENARRAEAVASEQRDVARAQSQLAARTLNAVIVDIQHSLDDLPGGTSVRRTLLTSVLGPIEKLSTDYVEQSAIDRDTLTALVELGDVLIIMGGLGKNPYADESQHASTMDAADAILRRASEIGESLVASGNKDFEIRGHLAKAYQLLGSVRSYQSKLKESGDFHQQAYNILRDLCAELPPDSMDRESAALLKRALALAKEIGEVEEGLALGKRVLTICEQLSASQPEQLELMVTKSDTLFFMGELYSTAGELEKAMEHYERAYDVGLLLREKAPLRPTTFWAMVDPLMSMAATARQQGKPDKLLEYLELAVQAMEAPLAADPLNLEYLGYQMTAQMYIGDTVLYKEPERAREGYEAALSLSQRLLEADPKNAKVELAVSKHYAALGRWGQRINEHEKAMEYFLKAEEIRLQPGLIEDDNWQEMRHLGWMYRCMGDCSQQDNRVRYHLKELSWQLRLMEVIGEKSQHDAGLDVALDRLSDAMLKDGSDPAVVAEAAAAIQSAVEQYPDRAKKMVNAARGYARAVKLLPPDAPPQLNEAEELREALSRADLRRNAA